MPDDRFTSIVLKNPGNRRSSKNGVVITLALFGVERAAGDAARLACRATVRRAVPSAKNSESASAASAIVIGPKIGVFQHTTSIPAGRNAQIAVNGSSRVEIGQKGRPESPPMAHRLPPARPAWRLWRSSPLGLTTTTFLNAAMPAMPALRLVSSGRPR
jgi:hypothetical protein